VLTAVRRPRDGSGRRQQLRCEAQFVEVTPSEVERLDSVGAEGADEPIDLIDHVRVCEYTAGRYVSAGLFALADLERYGCSARRRILGTASASGLASWEVRGEVRPARTL
jgi:hypothetical protein